MHIRFEWDPVKDSLNSEETRHFFCEAQTVFFDQQTRLIAEPDPGARCWLRLTGGILPQFTTGLNNNLK